MRTWTQDEEEKLKKLYETSTNSELAKMFPNKTPLAIYKKARKLGFYKSAEVVFKNRSQAYSIQEDLHKKSVTNRGYVTVYKPDHPRADASGRVFEHIVVFEEHTGITVPKNCVIHHLNRDKKDNRIENLCMMDAGAHTVYHHTGATRSDECKEKIRQRAKNRLVNPENHPSWKDVDFSKLHSEVLGGATVKEVCKKYGVSKSFYYERLRRQSL